METKRSDRDRRGINGAGIAADAAGRGLSVIMPEAQDLACANFFRQFGNLSTRRLTLPEHYEFRPSA